MFVNHDVIFWDVTPSGPIMPIWTAKSLMLISVMWGKFVAYLKRDINVSCEPCSYGNVAWTPRKAGERTWQSYMFRIITCYVAMIAWTASCKPVFVFLIDWRFECYSSLLERGYEDVQCFLPIFYYNPAYRIKSDNFLDTVWFLCLFPVYSSFAPCEFHNTKID
jgi:hypothetical protein